jgi:hypothetical protein
MAKSGKLPAGIVRAAIHPSIGIARIGNSEDQWFYGPEVTDPLPEPPGFYRETATGALKRQAARFRVYGLDAKGRAVAEITAANADITWTVHLANLLPSTREIISGSRRRSRATRPTWRSWRAGIGRDWCSIMSPLPGFQPRRLPPCLRPQGLIWARRRRQRLPSAS